jgi:hypothetical protein
MKCPDCENHFSYQIIYDADGAEEGEPFNYPSCNVLLRLVVDEGTYFGAQDRYIEVVD